MTYAISLRFLGLILRVLRLEVSVWISENIGKGYDFLSGLQQLYSKGKRLREFEGICKRLPEFEEI